MTKTWPEDVFPLHPVGRMVLNRNPDNFFNDNEQVAFCPAIIVPGESQSEATHHGISRSPIYVWNLVHLCMGILKGQTTFWSIYGFPKSQGT